MYWLLHLFLVIDVIGRTYSTCVQLHITSTCIPCFGVLYVRMSLAAPSVDLLGMLKDAIIPHTFNSVLIVGDCAKFKIWLYYLCSMPLAAFSFHVMSLFETACGIAYYLSLIYCITYTLAIQKYLSVSI